MAADNTVLMRTGKAVWILAWCTAALAFCLWAWPHQLARACWLAEWPFQDGCLTQTAGSLETATPQQLLAHLQRNVGDGRAYVWLASGLAESDITAASRLLPFLQQLAPHHNRALAVQVAVALQATDYDAAAHGLALLVERGAGQFRPPLVAMMLEPITQNAVRKQLTSESRWLDSALASADPKAPAYALLGFVTDGWTLGLVQAGTALAYVERLKQAGYWLDAYNLWVLVLGKVPEGLFNPGFDQRSSQRGFDWAWPQQPTSKSGMAVTQVSATPRTGSLLQVEMSGRAALPAVLVSQPLVLLGRDYQLRGSYKSDRLRSREGLVWALRCAEGTERFAQSAPMLETSKQWQSFEISFAMPDVCQSAVKLQLETAAEWERKAGMSGVVVFDDFELRPVGKRSAPESKKENP